MAIIIQKTSESLQQYYKDKSPLSNNNTDDFNGANNTDSFNFEVKITGGTGNDTIKMLKQLYY